MAQDAFITMDSQIRDVFYKLAREFPKWTSMSVQRYVNDMAFSYKEIAPSIIAKAYRVRNPAFVRKSFMVRRAQRKDKIKDIFSVVGSISFPGMYSKPSTGWEEPYTGTDSRKSIWTKGARGDDFKNKIDKRFIIKDKGALPDDSRLPAGIKSYYLKYALIDRVARLQRGRPGREGFALTKPPIFITGKDKNRGLYRFKGGALPSKGNPFPAIEPVMLFRRPSKPREIDWQGMV
jgi:hypothetical protein